MSKFKINDSVYAPARTIDKDAQTLYSLVRGQVRELRSGGRSAIVEFQENLGTHTIATSKLHADVGVMILRIGDFSSELEFLDPLSTSVTQYCRLLLPPDQIRFFSVRTLREIKWIVDRYHPSFTHWIIIGHGGKGHMILADNKRLTSSCFQMIMQKANSKGKTILSLCCHSGEAAFGKLLSISESCSAFIGPMGPVHGASACQFVQSFLGYHFLEGKTTTVAFNQTREQTPGGAVFRLWQNGVFTGAR